MINCEDLLELRIEASDSQVHDLLSLETYVYLHSVCMTVSFLQANLTLTRLP
jgi:hypothetical protein